MKGYNLSLCNKSHGILFNVSPYLLLRYITQALDIDESGDRMVALELYQKSLTLLRSGLASLQSSVGESLSSVDIHRLRGQMEKYDNGVLESVAVLD